MCWSTSESADARLRQQVISTFQADPDVAYVEPNVRMRATAEPDDPEYAKQWHYFEQKGGVMLVVDRRAALVPSYFGAEAPGRFLLIRSPALVDALPAAFERLWDSATPVGTAPCTTGPLTDKHAQVLRLLATGAKDQAITRALNITTRTVVRRVSELMHILDATTRFQAAANAVRRGWL